jgi:CBS domain-containing protein
MTGKLPPSTRTPLAALPALVLDLETTGLDVRNDRVVQMAAVGMLGATILDEPRLDRIIDPGVPMPATAARIHGLSDADVRGATRIADVAGTLSALLSGRVVIGHHIGFDLAMLRHETTRAGLTWHEPVEVLDIAQLAGALDPALPDLGLDTIATQFGIEIENYHTAMGDCMAIARVWAKLIGVLRDTDIRTLGEAMSFAARRDDLVLRQAQLGWSAASGSATARPVETSAIRIDGFAFERCLKDLMSVPPAMIHAGASLREAARTMVERRIGALLIGSPNAPPAGIVTERDLLRIAATERHDFDRITVTEVMTSPVESMSGDEMLYRALGRMDRLSIRHLCVLDAAGRAIGMVSQRDLLQHRARGANMLGDALMAAEDTPTLADAFARVPEVATRLVAEGLGGSDVARVVSAELRALTRRAAELGVARLEAEGHGPPPAAWCLLVLGSGGRGESLLGADQDNALIHTGNDDDDAWFAEFGAHIADLLDAVGVPRCKGGVMAATLQWRGTRDDWRERIDAWLRRARPEDLLNVDIFFDLVPVAGDFGLARGLHDDAVRAAASTPAFMALLAESVRSVAPRIGLFGGLVVKDGRVNLKRDGLLPLVSLARTLALRVGSTSRATPERLRDAVAGGRLADGDAQALIELHGELLTLILNQQLLDLDDGIPLSNRVELKSLNRRHRSRLKQGLRLLDGVVSELGGAVAR